MISAVESGSIVVATARAAQAAGRAVEALTASGNPRDASSPHRLASTVGVALLLKPACAGKTLLRAANRVRDPLRRGQLDGARDGLSWLCSRDPSHLRADELIAASIESVAENTSDSVVAPVFWFAVGGLQAAWAYRAINTLDAMIGYRGEWEDVGAFAARLDDVANLVPARLTAVAIAACAPLGGGSSQQAWRIARRDAAQTDSPNAGWPMAAMAGALGISLEKTGHYVLHPEGRPAALDDIERAQRVAAGAMLLSTCAIGATVALGSLLRRRGRA